MSPKTVILLAGVIGVLGIALGTFGAHGLPGYLKGQNLSADELQKQQEWFETGVRYHMFHAPLLLGLGLLALHHNSRWVTISSVSALLGVVIFSGLLYVMAVTGIKKLGMIVPIGGLAYIFAWVSLMVAAWKLPTK